MTHAALVAWALAAMIAKQPENLTPWADTYADTAEAFVTVAEESPLHKPENDGVRRTVADFVSVAWFEGRFNPVAKGDCRNKTSDGKCSGTDPQYQSFCTFQIGKSNFEHLKVTEASLLSDTLTCTRAASKMMKISASICRGRPADEWLANYAAGSGECGRAARNGERAGVRESRHRVNLSLWLLGNVPLPPS